MDTNETGREPTEPTDAELQTLHELRECLAVWVSDAMVLGNVRACDALSAVNASISAHRVAKAAFRAMDDAEESGGGARIDKEGWEPLCEAMDDYEQRMNGFCTSGQRPMPGSEVSRAEVLKASTDTLLNAEAERLPDTPAPDEVAQLRAEVVEQSATITRQFELLKGVANVLKGQAYETELWSHADIPEMATRLTARVAELEALCRVTLGQGKTIVSDASINGIMGGAPTTLLIQVLDESHTIGDDATGFGRDNLEPGDGNVQIVFTKAESVDVVIDTLFKIKGEIESTPAAPEGEGGGK